MGPFEPKITEIGVCTFQMSGKIRDSANAAFKAVIVTHLTPFFAIFGRASGQIFEKCRFWRLQALFTLVNKPGSEVHVCKPRVL